MPVPNLAGRLKKSFENQKEIDNIEPSAAYM
jgi:hypothetical protein